MYLFSSIYINFWKENLKLVSNLVKMFLILVIIYIGHSKVLMVPS